MNRRYSVPLLLLACGLLSACSPDKKPDYVGNNLHGFNHVDGTSVNWFTVNGAYGRGAAGTCCIMIPSKWQPGMEVTVEWEVDPDAYSGKAPPLGTDEFREYMKQHKANYRRYKKVVEVPEYDRPCSVKVHFLPCNEVKISLSCYGTRHPDYPIKAPNYMKEPAVCPSN